MLTIIDHRGRTRDCDEFGKFKPMQPAGKSLDECFDVKNVSWSVELKSTVRVIRPGRGVVMETVTQRLEFSSGRLEKLYIEQNKLFR